VGDGKTADHLTCAPGYFASGGGAYANGAALAVGCGKGDFDIRLPDHAIPGQGGVQVDLTASLADNVSSVARVTCVRIR